MEMKVEFAKDRLSELFAIGITERMEESHAVISKMLDLEMSGPPPRLNAAEDDEEPRMETLSQRELDALEKFTEFDRPIYETATQVFEEQMKSMRTTSGRSQSGIDGLD